MLLRKTANKKIDNSMDVYKPIIIVSLIGLVLSSCSDLVATDDFFEEADNIPVESIKQDSFGDIDLESRNEIFTNRDTFTDFWIDLHQHVTPHPDVPDINFDERLVVVSVMGVQSTTGHMIEITEAAEGAGILGFNTVKVKPGDDCVTGGALTNPYHIISIPRVDYSEVRFFEKTRESACK